LPSTFTNRAQIRIYSSPANIISTPLHDHPWTQYFAPKTILLHERRDTKTSQDMTPTEHEPSQGKASSLQAEEPTPPPAIKAEEPTPAPAMWPCPHVSNTFEQAKRLFLYKPPDAKHGYCERLQTCEDACKGYMDTLILHYLKDEPPALVIRNIIHLFWMDEVRDPVKILKSRTTADRLHTVISNLRLPLCRHLCLGEFSGGRDTSSPK
jgi:hypothetical protein